MESIRDRLRERRRRKRWRLLCLFILLVMLTAAFVQSWIYVHRPGFAFGSITISGTNLLTVEEAAGLSGSGMPFNLFNASAGRLQEALQHDIRFQSAEVRYKFPATLHILVQEREPAVYVANSYRSYLQVDYDGFVMNVTTSIPDARAPVVVGAQCGNVFLGDKVANESVLQILRFLQQIDGTARDRIAEIAVDDQQKVKLRLRRSFPVILGKVEELPAKAEIFMTVFNEIKDKNIQAEYIDLTFAKPYIKLLPADKQ